MNVPQHLALIPRDGFFCKDGKGWHTSSSGRGHALDWPWPSTILGALRTAYGRSREHEPGFSWQDTRDVSLFKLLALRRPLDAEWQPDHRVWPVPQDALWIESKEEENCKPKRECIRLYPRRQPENGPRTLGREVSDDDALRQGLWFPEVKDDAKPLSRPRWWSDRTFIAWLTGGPADFAETPKWGEKPITRIQTRVALNPETLTAEDAFLFSHDVVETLDRDGANGIAHEWAVGAETALPEGLKESTIRLGSDSRLAWVDKTLGSRLFEPPEELLRAFNKGSRGLRLVVVTPAKFPRGWLPSGFTANRSGKELVFQGQLRGIPRSGGIPHSEVILRAAFVPRPMHISGWNMTGGGRTRGAASSNGAPKETQRLVEPGAIYFFERVNGDLFTGEDARKLWFAALGARTSEGFGLVVPGVWDPAIS